MYMYKKKKALTYQIYMQAVGIVLMRYDYYRVSGIQDALAPESALPYLDCCNLSQS